ncbi:MAG: hypothetical protein RL329_1116 [Bacteroidota bacterium]|jgi:DNA-directed RNA polymerase specialized sigma24 family protein
MIPFRYKPSAEELCKDLQNEKTKAIIYLSHQIEGKIRADCQHYGLENETEEILNDVLLDFIKQIQLKKYVYDGRAQPSTYALKSFNWMLSKRAKDKKRHRTDDIAAYSNNKDKDDFPEMFKYSDDVEKRFESRDMIAKALDVLRQKQKKTDVCADLIQLFYIQEFSYEDILKNNLIPSYNDVGSLKSKKSVCMPIFREIYRNLL